MYLWISKLVFYLLFLSTHKPLLLPKHGSKEYDYMGYNSLNYEYVRISNIIWPYCRITHQFHQNGYRRIKQCVKGYSAVFIMICFKNKGKMKIWVVIYGMIDANDRRQDLIHLQGARYGIDLDQIACTWWILRHIQLIIMG